MCQVNYQGIHLLTIKHPNIWQGSLGGLKYEKQQKLPCEIHSIGYVHSKQGIMSFGSLGIYLGSPKVEARSQISKYRAKHLNVIVSGRQDSEAGYCGVQASRVWEISKNTNPVLGKGVTPRSQVKIQVKTSVSWCGRVTKSCFGWILTYKLVWIHWLKQSWLGFWSCLNQPAVGSIRYQWSRKTAIK